MNWVALVVGIAVAVVLVSVAVLSTLAELDKNDRHADRRRRLIQERLDRRSEDHAWAAWLADPPLAIVTAKIVFDVDTDALLQAFMDAEARLLRSFGLQRRLGVVS